MFNYDQNCHTIDLSSSDLLRIQTPECPHCGEKGVITTTKENWNMGIAIYEKGAFIQDAFPTLTAGEREQLMTGTHPECWNEIFSDDES
jgi:hypothetical protein